MKSKLRTFSVVISISLICVCLAVGSFAAPPWKDDGGNRSKQKKGKKGKKRGKPKKITICHRPPGNPDNEHEITISKRAWPAHKKHGDKKGSCNGFSLNRTIRFDDKKVTSVSLNSEGKIKFAVTNKTINFYSNGQVVRSVKRKEHIYKDRVGSSYLADCSDNKNNRENAFDSFKCYFYGSSGELINVLNLGPFNKPEALFGSKAISGYFGLTGLIDFSSNKTLWKLKKGKKIIVGQNDDYFLLLPRDTLPTPIQLRRIKDGSKVSETRKNLKTAGISHSGNYIFVATNNNVNIYDNRFNSIASWNYSQFEELKGSIYTAYFYEPESTIVMSLNNGRFFIGNYLNFTGRILSDTSTKFKASHTVNPYEKPNFHFADRGDNKFFVAGMNKNNKGVVRVIDIEKRQFLKFKIKIPPGPSPIKLTGNATNNILGIYFDDTFKSFKYEF